jgi:phage terminase large subunit-like protein
MKPRRYLSPDLDIVEYLGSLEPGWRSRALAMLPEHIGDALDRAWSEWAHDGQLEPPGNWSTWVIKAGRGFGKTLAGAQWVTGLIATEEPLRFALVGATLEDARRVMVEGKSGLIEVAGQWIAEWHASLGRLTFTTGASAQLFSGATPHLLRGPEHHYAWCDELAKWDKARECWDMLQLGLRLGRHPRALVTTTPRSGQGSGSVLQAIMDEPDTVVTGGPTYANPHLPSSWKSRVERLYAGTRLGRQELDGEIIPDAAGALWTVELIERCRIPNPPQPVPAKAGREGDPREAMVVGTRR